MSACALDPALVARLRDWLARTTAGMAWLTGTTGSGMTTMVAELTRDMEAVWLTPASMKTRAFLRDVCSHPLAVNGKRKVLVLDELDVLLGNETAMADVAFLVKHNVHVPVVCVLRATRLTTTSTLAGKAALVVHFPPPTHEAMVAAVSRVAAVEGLTGEVEELCRRAPGDIRHVLQTMRASATAVRDISMHTIDAVATVLGTRIDVRRALTLFSADAGGLPAGVFECYAQAATDVGQCTAYLDMVSLADVVDEHIHGRQRWDLLDVYGALTTASAAITLPRARGPVTLHKFGTVWNKTYARCSKEKTVRGIRLARASRGMTALAPEDLAFVRVMMSASLGNLHGAAEVCRHAGLDATACLGLMRLWGSSSGDGYKLTTHNKLKKLL